MRAAFRRMLEAHLGLLRAELELTGKELAIIVGLAVGALAIAILVGILLYVGGFLFFGELLFGSMGWGIIHGTLIGAAVIVYVGLNLAGGEVRGYGWGALIGVIVTVALAILLLSNVGNESGEWVRRFLVEEFQTDDLPFGDEWLVFLSGLVLGGLIGLAGGLIVAWRASLDGRARLWAVVGLILTFALVGAIYLPTRYDAPDGVLGLAIMIGLIVWIATGAWLTARNGFDPEARYANLLPRESIAAFSRTKEFVFEQWERQKSRMMGR